MKMENHKHNRRNGVATSKRERSTLLVEKFNPPHAHDTSDAVIIPFSMQNRGTPPPPARIGADRSKPPPSRLVLIPLHCIA